MTDPRRWFVLALALLVAAPVLAQDADSEKAFEEVVVTAQKKEQDLREVPVSVATLGDEKLDAITAAGNDIRLLSSRVPSLHIESSFGRTLPRFYIRGLGNTDFDLNASQPVSLVYDGVVLENPILKGYPMFDLERVEVLRGPQGTLFGRNTPAGIVSFNSRKPTYETGGFGRFSFGTYQTMQFEAAVNGAIVEDKLAARVSILNQSRNDWVKNTWDEAPPADGKDLGGYKDFAGRFQLMWDVTDRFNVLGNVHMRDLNGTARLFRADIVESGSNEIVGDFKRDEVNIDGANQQRVEETGAMLKLEYTFDEASLIAITGYETGKIYSRGDIDGGTTYVFPPDGFRFPAESADGIPDLKQVTQEIRYQTNKTEGLNYLVGFFYFDEDLDIDTYNFDTLTQNRPQNGYAYQTQKTTAWAGFATLEYDFNERWRASGGVRYSNDEKEFTAGREESPIGAGALDPVTEKSEADFVSWDVNALWRLNEDHNFYGRVAQGFRAPSFQGRLLFGDVITKADTEEILSYEIGWKANFSKKLRGNISVYMFNMKDQQLTAVGGETNFNQLVNADKTKGSGFEAEFEWMLSPQAIFTLGGSYNKTEIDDPNLYIAPGAAAGLTVLDPVNPDDASLVSIDGNSLPNAPEWVGVFTFRGSVPSGNTGEWFLFTDWNYRSEVNFFLYESVEFLQDGVFEGGLRIGWATYDRGFEVAAFGRNITDELYRNGGIDFNNLTGFVNEPRTFGMEVRKAF
jgi:iron complex outermembrane receptor protein